MNYRFFLLPIVASVLLSGMSSCTIGRKYSRPPLDMPGAFRINDSLQANSNDSGIATIPYKTFFKDAELIALIDRAIANNYDLQIAVKQIEYAEESLKQAKTGNIPSVTATIGSASINRPSDKSMNGTMFSQFLGKHYMEDYTSYIGVSWEADIWGKIKNRKEGALAALLQTAEARKTVQTQLVSNIAQGYYNLLLLAEQHRITQESIALYDSTISMTEAMQEVGNVNTLAVQQQKAAREAAAASLPQIERAMAVQENALSILIGENPQAVRHSASLSSLYIPETLPTGIPANIVSNRPDVRQAELEVLQSVSNENVARANMYPSLSISGQGGLDGNRFRDWFNIPGALFVNGLGSITTPIFQGRQLKTQYNQSKIASEQAVLTFKKTVQSALGDVSNALVTINKLKEQEKYTQEQVTLLNQAVENAVLLFQSGEANYLEVLSSQDNRLQAELAQADIYRQRLSAVVTLYQALGGGWK